MRLRGGKLEDRKKWKEGGIGEKLHRRKKGENISRREVQKRVN